MPELVSFLNFLARALAAVVAIGGLLGFIFRRWVGASIDAHFKRRLDSEIEKTKHEFAAALEEKKTALVKELEHEKSALQESMRRQANRFDKNSLYYETFNIEFGLIVTGIYQVIVLDGGGYFKETDGASTSRRKAELRQLHGALMEAMARLRKHESYVDVRITLRVATLFSDLSSFIADGASDKGLLDKLAFERGLICAELINLLGAKETGLAVVCPVSIPARGRE